jgi:hypothetical protein
MRKAPQIRRGAPQIGKTQRFDLRLTGEPSEDRRLKGARRVRETKQDADGMEGPEAEMWVE